LNKYLYKGKSEIKVNIDNIREKSKKKRKEKKRKRKEKKKKKSTARIGELFLRCHNVHRAVRSAAGTGPRQATGQTVPAQIPYLARHIQI